MLQEVIHVCIKSGLIVTLIKAKNQASVISGHQQDKVDYRAHSALCANFRLPVTWNSTTPAAITCHKHMTLTDCKKKKKKVEKKHTITKTQKHNNTKKGHKKHKIKKTEKIRVLYLQLFFLLLLLLHLLTPKLPLHPMLLHPLHPIIPSLFTVKM